MNRLLLFCALPLLAQTKAIDPQIKKIVDEISEVRIAAHMQKLESFGTRNTFTEPPDPGKGTKAARAWLLAELKSYSTRLDAHFDTHHVKKFGDRFFRDADVVNLIAVLPGKTDPARQIIVSAHYDTISLVRKPGTVSGEGNVDGEKSAAQMLAPGVVDNGSGTAAVLELARVLSQYEYDATLVFILFDAEEYGLVGANAYATRARKENQRIEAVFNNDIIGSDTTGDGRTENRRVNLYSEDPLDSPSRNLARYIKEVAERYVPSMKVDLVFRHDRFARGGDHTQFNYEGFAAVRFTSAAEFFAHQHNATDTLAFAAPGYTAHVAKLNAAALANLALAPKAPLVTRTVVSSGRQTANIARGKSGYAAVMHWKNETPEADLAGYKILMRSTLAPMWEREIFVGKVEQYALEGVNIDDLILAVQAVDNAGHEGLAAAYVAAPAPKVHLETQ